MKNILWGLIWGAVAGILDVIPMLFMKLAWNADLAAFIMWVVAGLMVATTTLRLVPVLKGLLISFLILLPSLFIISANGLKGIIPIIVATLILGSLLGFVIGKWPNGISKKGKPGKRKK